MRSMMMSAWLCKGPRFVLLLQINVCDCQDQRKTAHGKG